MPTIRMLSGVPFFLLLALSLLASTNAGATEPDAALARALRLFQEKNYEQSERVLEDLTTRHPRKALYWFNLGNARYMRQEFRPALMAYAQVIALRSPLAVAAELYSAKAHRQLGESADALRLLEALSQKKLPENLAADVASELAAVGGAETPLETGMRAYKAGEYGKAVESASRALTENPTAEAFLLRGMSEIRAGDNARARADLEEASRRSADAETRQSAQELLEGVSEAPAVAPASRRYWLTGDLAAGYNSNVFSDAVSVSHTSKPVIDGFVSLGGAPYLAENFAARAGYSLNWEETMGLSDLRFLSHLFYAQAEALSDGWSLQLQPQFQDIMLGTSTFLRKPGGRVRIQKALRAFDVGFLWDAAHDASGASQFNYLEGSSQLRKLYVGYTSHSFYLSLAYLDGVQYSSDLLLTNGVLPTGYHARGPGLTVSYFPTTLWELSIAPRYLFKSYMNQAYTNDIPSDRKDRLLDATAAVTYKLTRTLRPYLSVEIIRNWSNLDASSVADKNYEQIIALGGFSWDILP